MKVNDKVKIVNGIFKGIVGYITVVNPIDRHHSVMLEHLNGSPIRLPDATISAQNIMSLAWEK
ncbi:MAG: hypothetical protein ACTSWD_00035 [Candidatus Heimdallarchaeota archaeon]